MITEVEIVEVKVSGLLDTGSEISIIPGNILLRAKRNGYDIDSKVKEHAIDRSKRVYDASGVLMNFVTVIETAVEECAGRRKVIAPMYVCI
ncbi:hypothetical protein Y032_0060g3149 [Ancylostoma ceylanicum]|uniref:Peptidase A2 domain-containing protein n=1 Tax=Ancylostoma ceylanicum TaxID=53326 RepID=A0A016U314_9BILA|nr:hypothetical protein Y032_0060g3149 [Ancylostoma ceylanicum]